MSNVKPGDLCLVVGARVTPGLNGKVVEVVALAQHLHVFKSVDNELFSFDANLSGSNKAWEVKSSRSLPWKLHNGKIEQMQSRPIGDAFLFKIKDGDLTLDEETEISNNDNNVGKTKEKENQC